MRSADFIKIALKDYKTVGAVTVSSKYTVRKIVREIKHKYKYILEYGAGDGVVTKEILKILPPDGKLVAVELNTNLFDKLSKIGDRRLVTLHKNIIDVSENLPSLGLPKIDAVVSGVPFSFFKESEREKAIKNIYGNLADGGRFICYQIYPIILPIIKKNFEKIHYRYEFRNFLPYLIIIAEK